MVYAILINILVNDGQSFHEKQYIHFLDADILFWNYRFFYSSLGNRTEIDVQRCRCGHKQGQRDLPDYTNRFIHEISWRGS